MKASNKKIAIVGAGLVGLVMAHLLAKQGFNLIIIDKAMPELEYDDNIGIRVSAINRASQDIFEDLGLWQKLENLRMGSYESMVVWDEGSEAYIELDAAEIGESKLGFIIENHLMQKVLYEGLKQYNEQVQFILGEPQTLQQQGLIWQLRLTSAETIQADLLIGADGAKSWLRHAARIESSSRDFQQHALVCTVQTNQPHRFTAWQRFLKTGPLAFLPLHDPHLCSIVWSTTQEQAMELAAMPEVEFNEALNQAFVGPDWSPEPQMQSQDRMKVVGARACYPLHQHHADQYVQAGIALVGDAAHSIHPLAGQGVNLGFADAKVLARVLSHAANKGRNVASLQTLLQYQRARKHYNAVIMWSMYGFNSLFSNKLAILANLRQAGFNWVNKQAMLKRFFIKQAMGLNE